MYCPNFWPQLFAVLANRHWYNLCGMRAREFGGTCRDFFGGWPTCMAPNFLGPLRADTNCPNRHGDFIVGKFRPSLIWAPSLFPTTCRRFQSWLLEFFSIHLTFVRFTKNFWWKIFKTTTFPRIFWSSTFFCTTASANHFVQQTPIGLSKLASISPLLPMNGQKLGATRSFSSRRMASFWTLFIRLPHSQQSFQWSMMIGSIRCGFRHWIPVIFHVYCFDGFSPPLDVDLLGSSRVFFRFWEYPAFLNSLAKFYKRTHNLSQIVFYDYNLGDYLSKM